METQEYFERLDKEIKKVYDIAQKARLKNLDPMLNVEVPIARSLAEKVIGLISTIYPQLDNKKIIERIFELEKEFGKLNIGVSFKIAEEIAKQKYCSFKNLMEAMDAGIRVGFAYITLGVVSSPIEGYTGITTMTTKEGKEYIAAHFSGPIRSAGTTASCVVLMIIDYLRELFGYAKYDPSEDEIKRYVTENYDYHEYITNLQYLPTVEEATFLASHLPIQIDGDPTEKVEVSNYKNLKRVETNFIRGGMCLIFSEALAQKAKKGLRLLNEIKKKGIHSTGWDFLEEYVKIHEKREIGKADDAPTYIQDLVAGRPVFGHPSCSGAFRFRYGRSRTSGFSATSIHPATMAITDSFLAIGTQLKLEKPTKGCIVTPSDKLEGPIVLLKSGSVKKINSKEEAKKIYPEVKEILYLGDILFPYGDVLNRNSPLIKPGYVQEWWKRELEFKDIEYSKRVNEFSLEIEEAINISQQFSIPLHPDYIFYWTQISKEQFKNFLDWIQIAQFQERIIFPYSKKDRDNFKEGKRALELLGVEHDLSPENIILSYKDSKSLLLNLGFDPFIDINNFNLDEDKLKILYDDNLSVLERINNVSKFVIKDKAGEFIGARMGRPEKAKLRKLIGSPNMLFPVGREGGRLRSLQSACDSGKVSGEFPLFFCEKCKRYTIYSLCENCGNQCKQRFYSPILDKEFLSQNVNEGIIHQFKNQEIDINHYLEQALKNLDFSKEGLPLIKGVRGTSSDEHTIEHLEKGILRAKFNLQVNKDGTIRFDATEIPLSYFKPKEIFVSINKLKELGYLKDIYGNELTTEDQILELMPHDIILPYSQDVINEEGDDVFVRISQFIDTLLERFYKLPKFYNIKKKEDLIGQIGVCMAPHNCAGVICRFIGFSNILGLLASPYMHAAIRRDCDGDEAAIMLLGDVLLNFSRKFLSGHRGGTQDAPLVLNGKIDPGEVDDQILDFELTFQYPLELYTLAEQKKHSSEVNNIPLVRDYLKLGKDAFHGLGFTHDTDNFNEGVLCSSYKILPTMQDKVNHQMELEEKIRAVDSADTARLIIDRHFLKDLKGNLKKFSMQGFRCVSCNGIMRRPPIAGVCPRCGGKIIFTINEGGIKKYLEPALNLAEKYNLSTYTKQNLFILKENIDSVFGKEIEKQQSLKDFF